MGTFASSQTGEATTPSALSTGAGHPNALAASKSDPDFSTHEKDMIAILDELEAIAAIDPAAKQQLMDDLREAKQENWPLIVQQFKSALAYRQQLVAKEKNSAEEKPEAQQVIASKQVPIPKTLAESRGEKTQKQV